MACTLHFMLLFSLIIFTIVAADDSLVMQKLADAITPALVGWSTAATADYCQWEGVACDTSLQVNTISLSNKNLFGTLPSEISSLAHLQFLYLDHNHLSGPLPSLANLSSLQEVDLSFNNFSTIPQTFFRGLISLRVVNISWNTNLVPWSIPSDIGESTYLRSFYANEAMIMGSIPDLFASLPNLEDLRLSYNNLTGNLPVSFANSAISNLWLNNQQIHLSGSIDVLSSMTGLTQAWLHENQFTGPIPDLSRCQGLFDLQLRDNQLTGIVPASLISLPNLVNVSLSNNRLQGPVPKFKTNVRIDNVGNNYCADNLGVPCDPQVNTLLEIAGAVGLPATLSASWRGNNVCNNWNFVTCNANHRIIVVNFARQNFSGFISSAFGNLTAIKNLYLNDNSLTGSIPDSLTKLTQLEVLDVSNNNLSGKIPRFASSVKLIVSPGNPSLLSDEGSGNQGQGNGTSAATEHRGNRVSPFMISGVVVSVIALSALVVFVVFKYKSKKRPGRVNENPLVEFRSCHFDGENIQYSVEMLKQATNDFSEDNIIGKGGFGVVYKGELQNGTKIAVKRMKATAMTKNGKMNQLQAEISVLSKVRHRHLVALFGYYESDNEGFLIYEYMPKGTLKQHLFEWRERGLPSLTWKQRVRIALDVARGLEYLHNLTEQSLSFIHRDIKPSNILLGDDMRAKISDFGLVKKSPNGLKPLETRVAGTFGYLAPEYAKTGTVTKTVDVYAFGAILMEMITGKKAIDDTREKEEEEWMEIHLVTWFRRVLLNNAIYKKIDQNLNPDEESLESIYKVAELAGKCTADKPRQRPDIGYVVNFLVPLVEQWKTASSQEEETVINVPLSINQQQKHVTV